MTVDAVFTAMTTVLEAIFSMFGDLVTTITGNPLLWVPVILSLLGGLVLFALGVVRKLGIRGISSAGRRRRRR